ncbi:nitroreductase [Desulfovibrio sp. X2]|uniref:nitroreductase family protein n=1 Tax=Desulfovibrio sp. X2 TaxID=941449 RepID=UPI0003586F78|nr:nitroreductase family protein [Desulfovibrio sp. X2]EPR44317.1 nitroreductase [Desulfovibrio sp. X2]
MSLITVDTKLCSKDGLCAEVCPARLIVQSGDDLPREIEGAADICIRCGHCVAVCPKGALSNSLTPAADFLPAPKDLPTAEQTEGLLLARRSVREFKEKPVSREDLELLIEIGRRAPTASNSQNISWIVVQEPGRLAKIEKLCVDWMRPMAARAHYVRMADEGNAMVLRGAPALLVAHAPQSYPWGDSDSAIALSYVELQAVSMGLGVCWAGLVTRAAEAMPEVAAAIGLPEGQKVFGGLMLGHPKYRYRQVPPRVAARVLWH